LFFLTRFREELLSNGFDQQFEADAFPKDKYNQCITKTMETSGATIMISGVILAVAFVFLGMFPINLIASMGVGCFITMAVLLLVNLSLIPSILASHPVFFSMAARRDRAGAAFWRAFCRQQSGPQMTPRVGAHTQEETVALKTVWARIGRCVTAFPVNITVLILVVAAVGAVSTRIMTLKTTNDLRQDVGHGTSLFDLIVRLQDNFGGGVTFPYQVLILPKAGTHVAEKGLFSSEFFSQSGSMLQAVQKELAVRMPVAADTGFGFLSYLAPNQNLNLKVSWTAFITFCMGHLGLKPIGGAICQDVMTMMANSPDYLNYPPTAISGFIIPKIDPLGKDGETLLDTLNDLFDEFAPQYDMEAYVGGLAADATDMKRSLFSKFPVMIAATLAVAGLFLAATFKSIVIPLRAIVSNLLCLGVTYGISIMVYQDGLLNFTGLWAVSGDMQALPWIIPVVVFFVLTGIGLDYDVFLCVRITEYRNDGIEPTQAIVSGMNSVAGVIGCAGLVMVVAFGSLMFSSIQQLNMLGFMMAVSVTFCTVIACVFVNPALMSILGYYNWWPSAMSKKQPYDTRSFLGASMQPVPAGTKVTE
jgi:RND superfamily putative drug exporter